MTPPRQRGIGPGWTPCGPSSHYDPSMDETRRFYDDLAEDYTAIFANWDASVARQGKIIDHVIRTLMPDGARTVLDATCGIGTQAIGLALRGYEVTATDLSPVSVERARREAARLGASVVFKVADVRDLASSVAPPFDVAMSFDNALPHLVDLADLKAALGNLCHMLRSGGLLLVSIRDYDALLVSRPSGEPPRMTGETGSRRVVAQAWDWDALEPIYLLHQFVLREHPGGDWSARHFEARYRALRRSELASLAAAAGFGGIAWLEPDTTAFYQPILAVRAP
jgi:glycine/sarcosine N-methyltransferase